MMLTRPTLALAAISLGLFVLALGVIQYRGYDAIVVEGEGKAFLPQFADGAPDVSKIFIGATDAAVTLDHTDGIWRVSEKNNYPADGFRVQMLVNGLERSRKIEAKTSDPKYFTRVGLGEAAQTVIFEDAAGGVLADLELGDQYMSPAGLGVLTFVWNDEDQRVWAVSMLPEISTDPVFWVEPDILHLSQLRVKRITVTLTGNEAYGIERKTTEGANFMPLQPMGGAFNQEAINELGFALTDVFLDDVAVAKTGTFFHVADARYETFDGLVIDISFFEDEGVVWTAFSASYNAAVLEEDDVPNILPDAPADGAQEVESLNALWKGYIYKLPIELVSTILKRKQDLVR